MTNATYKAKESYINPPIRATRAKKKVETLTKGQKRSYDLRDAHS